MSVTLSSCFTTYQVESDKRVGKEDAHIVIYRKGIVGFAASTKVYADGKFVGRVGANRYLSCWLPEGEHLLSVRMTKMDEVFFKVNMVSGKTYAYSFSYGSSFFETRPRVTKLKDAAVLTRRRPPVVNYFN